jgi:hypothetical protein
MAEVPGLVLSLAGSKNLCCTLHDHKVLSQFPGGATTPPQFFRREPSGPSAWPVRVA